MLRELFNEYPYLLMLINIWLESWENHLEMMNMRVYEENGKAVVMVKGQDRKLWWFSSN